MRNTSTINFVKRHVSALPYDVPFSTRLFLSYGRRGTVDQCLTRLVGSGRIVRLARGIFVKPGFMSRQLPSVYEVAKVRAEAFGRTIFCSGAQAGLKLGLTDPESSSATYSPVQPVRMNSQVTLRNHVGTPKN